MRTGLTVPYPQPTPGTIKILYLSILILPPYFILMSSATFFLSSIYNYINSIGCQLQTSFLLPLEMKNKFFFFIAYNILSTDKLFFFFQSIFLFTPIFLLLFDY